MRNLLIGLTAGVFVMTLGMRGLADDAANAPAAPRTRAHLLARIANALKLTDQQRAQARQILQDARAAAQKATTPQQKAKIRREAMRKIRALLTDQQKAEAQRIRRHIEVHRLGLALKLTDQQRAKIKDILQDAHAAAQKATTPQQKAKIRKAAFEKIKAVLTPQQKAKARQIILHVVRRRLAGVLKLTADQQAQAKEIFQHARADYQQAATPQAKAKVRKAAIKKFRSILTDAQKKKLDEIRARHPEAAQMLQ